MNTPQDLQSALLARIDELESRIAIRDLASDYCHGFDKREWDRFLGIWWPDCEWDIGPVFGSFHGHDGITRAVHEVLWPVWKLSLHLTTNVRITFAGADSASAVSDVICIGTIADGSTQMVGATYSDELLRRDSCWKIRKRAVTMHFFNPVPGMQLSAPAA